MLHELSRIVPIKITVIILKCLENAVKVAVGALLKFVDLIDCGLADLLEGCIVRQWFTHWFKKTGEKHQKIFPLDHFDWIFDSFLLDHVVSPETTTHFVRNSHLDNDLFESLDNAWKAWTAVRVLVPTFTHEFLECRYTGWWDLWALSLHTHSMFKLIKVAVVRERRFASEKLPQHNAKRVDVGLFVEGFLLHHFWRHPKRRANRILFVLSTAVVQQLRQTKIANLDGKHTLVL
mmetsp:Transcript_16609/g.24780  ORF Transcript_16609/g.24780 Transcript_16609/m.24780 type:complete len:234 (+) Transcript_16609:592-1293(+)